MLCEEINEVRVLFCHDCFLSEVSISSLRAQNSLVRSVCINPFNPSVT